MKEKFCPLIKGPCKEKGCSWYVKYDDGGEYIYVCQISVIKKELRQVNLGLAELICR